MQKKFYVILLGLVACLCLNASVFADDDDDDESASNKNTDQTVYHLYDDVNLISSMKFYYGKQKIIAKSVYPELISESMDESIDHFNTLIAESIQKAIHQFKASVNANQSTQKNLPKSLVKNDLYIDYDTSVIKSKEENIISIRLSIQGFIAGMAHPYHYHHTLNYNLNTDELMDLSDLFDPESDYLNRIAQYCYENLSKHLRNKDMIAAGTAPNPSNYRHWNIKPNGLLITFDEYQVAPYANGAQMVLVPYAILEPFIPSDSPIAYCTKHTRRCGANSLLTGGFIDEAINTHHRALNPLLSQR